MKTALIKVIASGLLLSLCSFNASFAQSTVSGSSLRLLKWSIEEITDGSIPDEIVKDEREIPRNGLPDGRIATGTGDIVKAWYSEPTTRYRHAVLGDEIEAGALKVVNSRGETYTFRLPSTEVFEDITPRIADLDGDGISEVITILSSAGQGASVAVFNLNGNAFIKVGQTDFIGRSNRWLNIAEIENMGGDRRPEMSIVVTPHLAGILQFYNYSNGTFQLLTSTRGFSNHQIGSRELRLSTTLDADGNNSIDLVIPSLDRSELVIIGVLSNQFRELSRIELPAKVDKAIGTREVDGKTQIIVGLSDNKIYAISLQ